MVARTDRAGLIARHPLEMADFSDLAPERAVEQRVLDLFGVDPADAEADGLGDVSNDRSDLVVDGGALHVRRTAMLPQAMSKPTPLTEMCSS